MAENKTMSQITESEMHNEFSSQYPITEEEIRCLIERALNFGQYSLAAQLSGLKIDAVKRFPYPAIPDDSITAPKTDRRTE